MARRVILILAVLLPLGLVVSLPASLVLRSDGSGIDFQNVQGSVWAGQAQLAMPRQSPLPLRWRWAGGLSWDWQVDSSAMSLQGRWRLSARSRLSEITGRVDVQLLDVAQWFVVSWPEGLMDVDIDFVEWQAPNALTAQGQLLWSQARLAGLVNEALGDVAVVLAPSAQAGHTEISIDSNSQGVVRVAGEVLTNGDRFNAVISLSPDPTRSDIMRFLSALGPNNNGVITIERSGHLGVFK